ncbi:hypothetical protein MMC07_001498 [Pseudocyphellaria aurata]|nr:hypothetical protein [Pseudocyphellaria aurata]
MLLNSIFLSLVLAARGLAAPVADEAGNTLERRITHHGTATYYEQNNAPGSCGTVHKDSDYIAALSTYWQGTSYPPAYCGRQIRITNTGGGQSNNGVGKQITVTVADTCPGCTENHLDLSHGAFQALTGGNLDPPGTFNIDWNFLAQ